MEEHPIRDPYGCPLPNNTQKVAGTLPIFLGLGVGWMPNHCRLFLKNKSVMDSFLLDFYDLFLMEPKNYEKLHSL